MWRLVFREERELVTLGGILCGGTIAVNDLLVVSCENVIRDLLGKEVDTVKKKGEEMAVLDGEARVLLTAQHIIKALGTSDAMTDDMISVLTKFDHRFRDMNDKNLDRRSDASTSGKSPKGEDSDPDFYDSPLGPRERFRARKGTNSVLDSVWQVINHWDMGHGACEGEGYRWIFESNV